MADHHQDQTAAGEPRRLDPLTPGPGSGDDRRGPDGKPGLPGPLGPPPPFGTRPASPEPGPDTADAYGPPDGYDTADAYGPPGGYATAAASGPPAAHATASAYGPPGGYDTAEYYDQPEYYDPASSAGSADPQATPYAPAVPDAQSWPQQMSYARADRRDPYASAEPPEDPGASPAEPIASGPWAESAAPWAEPGEQAEAGAEPAYDPASPAPDQYREPPAHEVPVDEPAVHEPAVHEPAVHEAAVHEAAVHEPADHEFPAHEPIGQEPADYEAAGQEPADYESADYVPADREPANYEPADHEPADYELADQEPADYEPPVREPPVREPPVREPPVREPPVREPAVRPPGGHRTSETADSLTAEVLLRGRHKAPSGGWRRAVYRGTGGLIRAPQSAAELRRRELTARARTPVSTGHHRVAVMSLKGGVGKTTTTVGLGATLAWVRGDRVIALDANPDRGTLSDKLRLETSATVRDLLNERDQIQRYADVRGFTTQAPSRLEVLASDRDPTVSVAFSEEDYYDVARILEHYYSVCLADCGTGLLHSAMAGVLRLADQIVLVSSPSVDGARSASATLDWLQAHGYGDLVRQAVVALSVIRPRSKSTVDMDRLEQHFAARSRAVVRIPYDPYLEEGAEVDLAQLGRATADAYLALAAEVGDGFARPRRAARAGTAS